MYGNARLSRPVRRSKTAALVPCLVSMYQAMMSMRWGRGGQTRESAIWWLTDVAELSINAAHTNLGINSLIHFYSSSFYHHSCSLSTFLSLPLAPCWPKWSFPIIPRDPSAFDLKLPSIGPSRRYQDSGDISYHEKMQRYRSSPLLQNLKSPLFPHSTTKRAPRSMAGLVMVDPRYVLNPHSLGHPKSPNPPRSPDRLIHAPR